MTAATETIDITDRLGAIEETTNEGFRKVAALMPGNMAARVERTGARFKATGTVSADGIDITLGLVMDNDRPYDAMTAVDYLMVQEFASVFSKRFLNR